MRKIWVKKSNSFKEAQQFDIDYYLSMSPSERLETMQFLREPASKLKNEKNRKRLRRVIKVVQVPNKRTSKRKQDEVDLKVLSSVKKRTKK